jgi:uncharacterized membrane protein YbhN (UPF0104 family)
MGQHRLVRALAPLLGAALFSISIWVLNRELHQISFAALRDSFAALPPWTITLAICLTALNYAVLTCHDQLAFVYAGVRVPRGPIGIASFVG